MKYAVLMWGAEVTSANNAIWFQRTTGAPAHVATAASLSTAPGSDIPDFIPIGNGASYDLLASLAAALTAADGTDTYSVTLATDATTGRITGAVRIENDAGNDFTLFWPNVATTARADWFGHYAAPTFVRTSPSYSNRSSTSGVLQLDRMSSLIWVAPEATALHLYEPNPTARVVGLRTISGRSHTRRIAVRAPSAFTTLSEQITQKGTTGNQVGGRLFLEFDRLAVEQAHRTSPKFNRSLEPWWDHASAGKWFLLFEDQAKIAAGTGGDEKVLFCRLLDETMREDYGAIVTQQSQASPRYFDARMTLESVDVNHLGAGGS